MSRDLPLWPRLLFAVDDAFRRASEFERAISDELIVALTSDDEREAITLQIYDRSPRWSERRDKLFEWEMRLLDRPEFPRSGSLLLGAAGTGRELTNLVRLGYTVDAFEPTPSLYAASVEAAAPLHGRVSADPS